MSKLNLEVLKDLKEALEMIKGKKRPDIVARQLKQCSIEDLDNIIKHLDKPVRKKKEIKDEE